MRRLQIAAATLLAVVAIPATAAAKITPYTELLSIYTATGGINSCQFTSTQLNGALKTIDVYGQAYFPDFANAIQAALVTRASGGCSQGPSRGAQSAGGAGGAGGGSSGLALGPVTAATDAPIPAPIAILAVLVAAFLALAAAVAITRARGWDPRWAAAARHSLSEAGYRLGGIWEEFVDRD
jgi:hypothetical protein